MKIFSKHRKKIEPKRRFGGLEFRKKIKSASKHKRLFNPNPQGWFSYFLGKIGLASKFWRSIVVILILVIIYYLFVSPFFVVAKIQVSGNVQVGSEEIKNEIMQEGDSRLFFIKKNNLILLGTGNVKKILTRRFPLIKDVVQTKRIWPNQLVIEVKERIPGFVIESDGKYFLIDEDGVVFDQIMDPGEMLIVKDQEVEDFARGESLGNTRLAGFVLALSRQWDSKINTPIASIIFGGKNTPDVQVETLEGWSVMFDTQRPVVVQLNNLAVLLNKTITEQDRTHLAYIDLRLETKVFICYKEKPCGSPPQADPEIPPTTP